MNPYDLLRPLFFQFDPELAHNLTIAALSSAPSTLLKQLMPVVPELPCRVMGLDFPNPVGLAAGLDKNGECLDAWAAMGFGFVEIGTVTPRPQPGNPKPRLFRLPEAQAIINRMGFNNHGVDALLENVDRSSYRGILGINIGKNLDTPIERAADDYLIGLRKVYARADYVAINISSPNTKNLRALQSGSELDALLAALKSEQQKLSDQYGKFTPVTVKIAPDLDDGQISEMAALFRQHRVDGIIATNTTIGRTGVEHLPSSQETGGLSGAPVLEPSNRVLASLHKQLAGEVPLIGVGGILVGKDACDKLELGASLVQIYTGLIYRGPLLIAECVRALQTK